MIEQMIPVPPEEGEGFFKAIRKAVETGIVPDSPDEEDILIVKAKEGARFTAGFKGGSHAIAEWEKKRESEEERRRELRN